MAASTFRSMIVMKVRCAQTPAVTRRVQHIMAEAEGKSLSRRWRDLPLCNMYRCEGTLESRLSGQLTHRLRVGGLSIYRIAFTFSRRGKCSGKKTCIV
jgi:hypothetical protein